MSERSESSKKRKKRGNPTNVVYICDGKACEGGCQDDLCSHTTDIEHALNFIIGGRRRSGEPFYMEVDRRSGCELSSYKKGTTMIKKRYIVDVEYSAPDKGIVVVKEVDFTKPSEYTVAAVYAGSTGISVIERLLGEETTWFEESEVENNEGPQE